MFKKICIIILPFIIFFASLAHADITGKVVGVSDGDTIKVLQDHTQFKIRLYGIDCPESHQDFGTKAKQFTSDMVFGKQVKVIQQDIDRYGRTVGIVYTGKTCLNEEIIKNGFAWFYRQYCKAPLCEQWKRYEETARNKKIGLWSHPAPMPPWDFRHGAKTSSEKENISINAATVYHGNVKSMVFHRPDCKSYNCKNCTAVIKIREEAINEGFKPCGICKP